MKIYFFLILGLNKFGFSETILPNKYPLKHLNPYSTIKIEVPILIPPQVDRIFFYEGYTSKNFRGFPFCEIQVHSNSIARLLSEKPSTYNPYIILGVGEYRDAIDKIADLPMFEIIDRVKYQIHEVWLTTDSANKLNFRCVGKGHQNNLTVGHFRKAFGNFVSLNLADPLDFHYPNIGYDRRDEVREKLEEEYTRLRQSNGRENQITKPEI